MIAERDEVLSDLEFDDLDDGTQIHRRNEDNRKGVAQEGDFTRRPGPTSLHVIVCPDRWKPFHKRDQDMRQRHVSLFPILTLSSIISVSSPSRSRRQGCQADKALPPFANGALQ